jgi:hypothetical protein
MNRLIALATVLIAVAAAGAQDDRAPKIVRPDDVAMAQILNSLSRPTQAQVDVNDIKIPSGEVTRCDSYTHGNHTESDCGPHTRFEEVHQLVLLFSVNGQSVKIVAGCSSLTDGSRCHGFTELAGTNLPNCRGVNPFVCVTKGIGTFQIEGKKKKHQYFAYPVEGGKPNRRYEIPVVTVNEERLVDFDRGSWEPIEKAK